MHGNILIDNLIPELKALFIIYCARHVEALRYLCSIKRSYSKVVAVDASVTVTDLLYHTVVSYFETLWFKNACFD